MQPLLERESSNITLGKMIVFVTLVTQHAKRMRLVLLSSVGCPAVQYFSKLCHKQNDFRKKNVIE